MIELTKYEVKWIKHCKGHYSKDKFPSSDPKKLMPLFEEIYGWSPKEDYNGFLECIFRKLLDIWLRIGQDGSNCNSMLNNIFAASFSKSVSRDQELPIERAISELISMIAFTTVIKEDGTKRFNLDE